MKTSILTFALPLFMMASPLLANTSPPEAAYYLCLERLGLDQKTCNCAALEWEKNLPGNVNAALLISYADNWENTEGDATKTQGMTAQDLGISTNSVQSQIAGILGRLNATAQSCS